MRIKPKKSLGQNFLVDPGILAKIAGGCGLSPEDTVIEIGAGRGELTRVIAPKVKKLIAFELDRSLIPKLEEEFKANPNVEIIHQDILRADISRFTKVKAKVVGNIPYYISTPILEKLFAERDLISLICLTVQKEFAERVVAIPGSKIYGSLSCFVQYYGEPEISLIIKKGSFYPAPKVDSAFLRVHLRDKALLAKDDEGLFFKIVRAAFNQRRKTLRNSLSRVIIAVILEDFLASHGLRPDIRPERLTLQQFLQLAKYANSRNKIK